MLREFTLTTDVWQKPLGPAKASLRELLPPKLDDISVHTPALGPEEPKHVRFVYPTVHGDLSVALDREDTKTLVHALVREYGIGLLEGITYPTRVEWKIINPG